MRNRILIALFASVCCIFLLASCGGGGGGGTPVVPCANCISVDSATVAFGDVLQNGVLEKTVLVQNIGTGSLIIGRIAVGNPVAAPFQIWSDGCSSATLVKSQICAVKVRFSPTSTGTGLSDAFDIPSNDPNTVTVSLSGNGIAPPAPPPPPTPPPPVPPTPATINVSTTQIAFGDVLWNASSDQTITVRNVGSLNLAIQGIAQANPLAAPFSILSDGCSNTTLGANNTCALVARFSPVSPLETVVFDAFDIPSNDPGKPSVSVIVSGKGKSPAAPPPPTPPPPTINVSSNNLSFGNVVWSNTSELTIFVQNTASAGSDNLLVGQIAQANPLAAPFSITTDNCSGRRLDPTTETCAVVVQFAPTTQGSGLSDSFDIPSNDPNIPSVRVDVSGNGRGLRVSINDVFTNSCPDNIALRVAVADQLGNPITGLTQSDLSLSENGVAKPATGFSSDLSQTPVSVVLTLDDSGTMLPLIDAVKAASKGFVDQLLAGDEAAVISFNSTSVLRQTFTTDKVALNAAIDSIPTPLGFTALYDAVFSSIDNAVLANPANNRAIILISDMEDRNSVGDNVASVKTLDEVIAHANASQVAIFTIGLGDVATDVMLRLANETGGQAFPAPDTSQLGTIYTAIRKIINGAYTVTYSSSVAPGGSALLDVFVISGGLQGEVSRTVPRCP